MVDNIIIIVVFGICYYFLSGYFFLICFIELELFYELGWMDN